MRKIVIVDPVSSGANFVADIVKRGYEPVVVLPYVSEDSPFYKFTKMVRELAAKVFPCEPLMVYASQNYEETLENVRKLDPVAVICGSEGGVELATRLAEDLGLPGNPVKNMDAYLTKSGMHAQLLKSGVRSIRGRMVRSYEEARAFMDEIGSENVVLKPTRSAGSVGIKLCSSDEDVRNGFKELLGSENFFGNQMEELLIQERIFGTEYIVNTVSRNGRHKLLSIWKYDKLQTERGGYIYNYCESVNELDIGSSDLIEYAFSVLDALGIKNGPVHGEYMIDKKGPVLIEVNCRPMGGGMPPGFLDKVQGHHETDAILDAFLDEEHFIRHLDDEYHLLRKGYLKVLIAPKAVDVVATPGRIIAQHLKSFYSAELGAGAEPYSLVKTEDFETTAGYLFLVHDDPEVATRECNLVHLLETQYFRILFHGTGKKETPRDENALTVEEAIRIADTAGCSLIVSNRNVEAEGIKCVSPDELDQAPGEYDQVFFSLSSYDEEQAADETMQAIFDAMEKVKYGGRFIVPQEFYQMIPYSRAFIEALMTLEDFEIEAPVFNRRNIVVGRRI